MSARYSARKLFPVVKETPASKFERRAQERALKREEQERQKAEKMAARVREREECERLRAEKKKKREAELLYQKHLVPHPPPIRVNLLPPPRPLNPDPTLWAVYNEFLRVPSAPTGPTPLEQQWLRGEYPCE